MSIRPRKNGRHPDTRTSGGEWSPIGAARKMVTLRDEILSTLGNPIFNSVYTGSILAELRRVRDGAVKSGEVSVEDAAGHYRAILGDGADLFDEPAIAARVWELVDSSRRSLTAAPLFVMSPDMHRAVMAVSTAVNRGDLESFTEADITWPSGILTFPRTIVSHDRFGEGAMEALSWQVVTDAGGDRALRIQQWSRGTMPAPLSKKVRPAFLQLPLDQEHHGPPPVIDIEYLRPEVPDDDWIPEGYSGTAAVSDTEVDDYAWETDSTEAYLLVYLYTFLILASQRVTGTETVLGVSGKPSRGVKREPLDVTVVRLRQHHRSGETGDHPEWAGWWTVSGGPLRYRNRNTGEVKLTWRSAHVRGNTDGPMVGGGTKVNALLR